MARTGERGEADGGWDWPICTWHGPHPVPDLNAVPRQRWEEALRDAHPQVRRMCVQHLPPQEWAFATAIEIEIAGEARDVGAAVARRLAWPDGLPTVQAPRRPRPRPPGRQVNFRLDDRNSKALDVAAASLGMRPTALARLLTLRGLRGIERERRRAG